MNNQITLLKKSIEDLKNGLFPFNLRWMEEHTLHQNSIKEDFLFISNIYAVELAKNAENNPSELNTKASEDFNYIVPFLTEQWKYKTNLVMPNKYNIFNPFGNKWKRDKDFELNDRIALMRTIVDMIES